MLLSLNQYKKQALLFLFITLSSLHTYAAESKPPEWWGNDIGKEKIVLPDFDPVKCEGSAISLFERKYIWGNTFLPEKIISRGIDLVRAMKVRMAIGSEVIEIKPDTFELTSCNEHDAKIKATAVIADSVIVEVKAVVEYDGLSTISLVLKPISPVEIHSLSLLFVLSQQPSTKVIAFKADGIGKQKNRNDMISVPYRGEMLNVIGVSDGERSFWWIADHASGWVKGRGAQTTIEEKNNEVEIKQNIIGKTILLEKKRSYEFGFMATPIKLQVPERRSKRIMWGPVNESQLELKSAFKTWWTTAFVYDALPYVEYTDDIKAKLLKNDLKAYPGLVKNNRLIENDLKNFGVNWIPYFSARVLSEADPNLVRYKKFWKVIPEKTFRDGLNPYSNAFDKPVLSHRAEGYTDYIIWRLNDVISKMKMQGIYLDHGAIHESSNKYHTGSFDESGAPLSSMDILATRKFLKRLRTLFYLKGREGYIFTHISNREIIPAYGFSYGLVDGEQFSKKVSDGEYLDHISLPEFRVRFAGGQYGVYNYWLALDWRNHTNDKSWMGSDDQKSAYRRVEGLALLHDVPLWPHGAHRVERRRLLAILDDFGMDTSEFIGYWEKSGLLQSDDSLVKVSQYVNDDAILHIIFNSSREVKSLNLSSPDYIPKSCKGTGFLPRYSDSDIDMYGSGYNLKIEPYGFTILTLTSSEACSSDLLKQ